MSAQRRVSGSRMRPAEDLRVKDGRPAKVCTRCGLLFAPKSNNALCMDCRGDKFYRERTGQ